MRTSTSSWPRRSASASRSIATIFPCMIVKLNTTRGRPPGAHTAPAAPMISAGCAALARPEKVSATADTFSQPGRRRLVSNPHHRLVGHWLWRVATRACDRCTAEGARRGCVMQRRPSHRRTRTRGYEGDMTMNKAKMIGYWMTTALRSRFVGASTAKPHPRSPIFSKEVVAGFRRRNGRSVFEVKSRAAGTSELAAVLGHGSDFGLRAAASW